MAFFMHGHFSSEYSYFQISSDSSPLVRTDPERQTKDWIFTNVCDSFSSAWSLFRAAIHFIRTGSELQTGVVELVDGWIGLV